MKTIGINLVFSAFLTFMFTGCKKENESFKAFGINGERILVESVGGFGA